MTEASVAPFGFTCDTLEGFFSGPRQIELPWSQRGYAWRTAEMYELIEDVEAARQRVHPLDYHTFGRLLLARTGGPIEQLLDGNQRITSLQTVFAVLRDLSASPDERDALDRFVWGSDGEGNPTRDRPRLLVQNHAREFFADWVLRDGATLALPVDVEQLGETERNLLANRDAAVARLSALSPTERRAFAEFLLRGCWVTTTVAATLEAGLEMLKLEEHRGLDHNTTDLVKFELISVMPRRQQEAATAIWDNWQTRLGSKAMYGLIAHTRTIKTERRPRNSLLAEIKDQFRLNSSGLQFMTTELAPRAAWLLAINTAAVECGSATEHVRRRLATLSWLEQTHWLAPALRWFEVFGKEHPQTASFFARLERLTWLMRIAAKDPVVQENRFIAVLRDIRSQRPSDDWPSLAIERGLRDEALGNLRSPSFQKKQNSASILRRIYFELGEDPGPIDQVAVTIEHILPKSDAKPPSPWAELFSPQEKRDCAYQLGNLTFLSHELNQRAGNHDFSTKADAFRRSELAQNRALADQPHWTPATIGARTEALANVLIGGWEVLDDPPKSGALVVNET